MTHDGGGDERGGGVGVGGAGVDQISVTPTSDLFTLFYRH